VTRFLCITWLSSDKEPFDKFIAEASEDFESLLHILEVSNDPEE
jgi:hypothetical protein